MSSAIEGDQPRALCYVQSPSLKRTLRRTLRAAGTLAEFREDLASSEDSDPSELCIVEHFSTHDEADALLAAAGKDGNIVAIGESLENDDIVEMLRQAPLNHIISDADELDEDEMVITSSKLRSDDIFGLEKYLSWGSQIQELSVGSYGDKRGALRTIVNYAKEVGARRPVIARIESVTDELLMNALYDAPAIRQGTSTKQRIEKNLGADAGKSELPAQLAYGCDGRYLGISVVDTYGELRKDAIIDHLLRARSERGRPRDDNPNGGAGLGLYFIVSSVTRFIVNIHPGKMTEVICLFDLKQKGRDTHACARSLHIFRKTPS